MNKSTFRLAVLVGAILISSSLWYRYFRAEEKAISPAQEKNSTRTDESAGMHLKEKPLTRSAVEEGMLSVYEVIVSAQKEAYTRNTCDTNFPPTISFSNNAYKVTHWMRENPFRRGSRYYDSIAIVDPWTGEIRDIEFGQYGAGSYGLDPSSLGLTKEDRALNLRRAGVAVNKLNTRILNGASLSDDLPNGALLPPDVLKNALSFAFEKERIFDDGKTPLVVLVEDVYVVVLWKKTKAISEDGYLYDSRVFVDAFSGGIIGLEVAR